MSSFSVSIKRIRAIEVHPNADAIEFAVIDGYRSIVKKGQCNENDLVAYIPESSVLPDWLLKKLGLWNEVAGCGKLSGKNGNRVKAIKLRGKLSQGICYPVLNGTDGKGLLSIDSNEVINQVEVCEGEDVSILLGITKYEPPIPISMQGEVFNAGQHLTLNFDVENWRSFPDLLQYGEEVIFTEKLHGTCTGIAILPDKDAHPEAFGVRKNILIFSKSLGAKGLAFKNNEKNQDKLYVHSTRALIERIDALLNIGHENLTEPLFIVGETFGSGVQDLHYGSELSFRVFAVATGYRGDQHYVDWLTVENEYKVKFGFETVPVLYCGPYSEEARRTYTDGKTLLNANHLREGIVMVPVSGRYDPEFGRVCLKSVSDDYLFRQGGTEFS